MSAGRPVRVPGPEHPIAIAPNPRRVLAIWAGEVVADTRNALTLREAGYRAVQYIPREDVEMSRLTRTDHATYCPFKGDAAYYSLPGERGANAVWTYEAPFPAVAEIKDRLAFYADRVEVTEAD